MPTMAEHRTRAGCCVWCGVRLTQATRTRDHFIPRMFGAIDDAGWNVVPACRPCNAERGRIHDFYRIAMRADPTDAAQRRLCSKLLHQRAAMQERLTRWAHTERAVMGWSVSADMNLDDAPLFSGQWHQRDFETSGRRGGITTRTIQGASP